MSDAKTLSERIDLLETRLTFQDETIETLNKTITAQWQQIDTLTRQVTALNERLQEAEANAREIEGRLRVTDGSHLQVDRVPEVASARGNLDFAEAELERARSLVGKRRLSPADFDKSRTQAEASRRH